MSLSDTHPDAATIRRLRRIMALFTGLLVVSTWPLWIPGTAFPQIPWLRVCCRLTPDAGEIVLVGNLAVFLLLQFVNIPRRSLRWGLNGFFFLTSVPLLLLLDQHRLQPWAWQMLLAALLIGLSSTSTAAVKRVQWLTISIYCWSAVSKLDAAFLEGHGQLLLQGLTESVGISTNWWPPSVCRILAATFPLGELLVAIALMLPGWRRVGLWGATLMHVALLLTLGPGGLGHEWGVLIWNAFFLVNIWLLFGGPAGSTTRDRATVDVDPDERPVVSPAALLTWLVCLVPVLSLVGWWDWWPAWAVYSSRPAIVQMQVQETDMDRLPEALRSFVGSPTPMSEWVPVHLDAWSYATCRCPMYPQQRYRLAVIDTLVATTGVTARVIVRSTPDRWTGERRKQVLDEISLPRARNEYFVNTSPRTDGPGQDHRRE